MSGGIILTPGRADISRGDVVAPLASGLLFTSSATWGANSCYGARVVIPRSGTLTDLAVYVAATSAGNIDVGVYSAAGTRAKLYSTGAIACPTANQWNIVGALSLAVTAGDQLDFALSTDSGTATFGRSLFNGPGLGGLPSGYLPAVAGSPKLSWGIGASHPLPATFTEGSIGTTTIIPAIIARIA